MILKLLVTGADVHEQAGGCRLVESLNPEDFKRLEEIAGDAGFRGEKFESSAYFTGTWDVRIITRKDAKDAKAGGFVVEPVRWIVERTFAWLSKRRRLRSDFEKTVSSGTAWIYLTMIFLMTNRLASAQG